MATYPSPCSVCVLDNSGTCDRYKSCSLWKTRYYYRQRQINAKNREMQIPLYERAEAFVYEHPDHTRRFLEHGPCVNCPLQETCDFPCPSRLLWWDMSMEILQSQLKEG